MMSMEKLYNEKIGILREALALTEGAAFRGTEEDADVYIDLIDKRDKLFERAKAIDAELAAGGDSDNTAKKEIAELARRIIEQDNYMKETVTKILGELKTNVKNVNMGRNLNSAYIGVSNSGGSAYDWSK